VTNPLACDALKASEIADLLVEIASLALRNHLLSWFSGDLSMKTVPEVSKTQLTASALHFFVSSKHFRRAIQCYFPENSPSTHCHYQINSRDSCHNNKQAKSRARVLELPPPLNRWRLWWQMKAQAENYWREQNDSTQIQYN
jgi:hypothetical protein